MYVMLFGLAVVVRSWVPSARVFATYDRLRYRLNTTAPNMPMPTAMKGTEAIPVDQPRSPVDPASAGCQGLRRVWGGGKSAYQGDAPKNP